MHLSKLTKRLLPLYLAKFFLNIVFWYSVEKLFMTEIGFNSASIGLMVALYSAVSLAVEIPSGILADRWSRKGVLILAAIFLGLSATIASVSYAVPIYLISAVSWGFYNALTSGTYDSIIYDTLLEEEGHAKNYEKTYGRLMIVSSIGLIVSALTGGLIGQYLGLRATFILSIPLAIFAILFIVRFREPQLHKQTENIEIILHTKKTLASVFKNPKLIWILVSLFSASLILSLIMEMSQLWLIALAVPTAYFGIAGAVHFSTFGIGGILAKHLTSKRRLVSLMGVIFLCSLILVFGRNAWVNIGAQFLTALIAFGVIISSTRQIHDHLPSNLRAGAGSALNTAGQLIFIPLVLLFGTVANNNSIFIASWIIVSIIMIGIISELRSKIKLPKWNKVTQI